MTTKISELNQKVENSDFLVSDLEFMNQELKQQNFLLKSTIRINEIQLKIYERGEKENEKN